MISAWWLLLILPAFLFALPVGMVLALKWLERIGKWETRKVTRDDQD